ncbi:peptidoglycan-binding protein [Streptomyces sp. NPDC090994]|uniref:peptidoglycan-binding protein n=1 Tax=Streptomyces sp. NPDC090994 TaxID=3365969 RepID=UPI0038260B12
MSRWKELPGELPPPVRQLIVRLRTLKDRGELSTRQLAVKTGYSARSWQRYLNGGSLPPRAAVEAMARVGGDDPARLLALHEIAAERWAEGQPAPVSAHTGTDDAARRRPYGRHPYPRALVTAGAVALVLSVSVTLLLAVRLAETRERLARVRTDTVAAAPATVSASLVPVTYTCRPEQRDGRWYAGLSRTSDTILAYTHVGPEVAEAQCLLRRAGISPGDIDGVFGPRTQRAVQRVQKRHGLVVDGVIGPHTWQALREVAPR